MREIKVKAPAKINLGLHVISRRVDGYHNIETIFYPINLFDVLTFKESDEFTFTSTNQEINESDNLIIKAKNLLEDETKQKIKVHIHLEKNIPVGAGLGGGSSDAALTLKTLNKLFNFNLDREKLSELALILGSDVPFFLNPKPCFASSRGEKLEYLAIKIPYSILIINPGIHISTKWAYSMIIPKKPNTNLNDFRQKDLNAPNKLKLLIKNDFEEIVFKEYPQINGLKEKLYKMGSEFVLMSGSGSTLFAFFKDVLLGEKVRKELREEYFIFYQKTKFNF